MTIVRWCVRNLVALVVMAAGTAGVCAIMLAMNDPVPPKAPDAERQAVAFQPQRKKPKRKKPKPKPKPQKPREAPRAAPPTAPAPVLATGLSSVSLGIPGVGAGSLETAGDDMLGAGGDPSALVMNDRSVDTPPKARFTPKPRFPPRAARSGQGGKVVVRLLIGADGSVAEVRIMEASPPGVFDGPVLEAVQRWRFEPARYKGQPVKMWTTKTLRFQA